MYGVLVSTSARISRSFLILSAVRGLLASDVGLNRIFPGMTAAYLFNPLHSQCQGQLFPGGRFDFERLMFYMQVSWIHWDGDFHKRGKMGKMPVFAVDYCH